MKKINWQNIWRFLKSNLFSFIVIVCLVVFSTMQCNRIEELKRQQSMNDQNSIALRDSLKFVTKKNGELEVSIAGFIADNKTLKELNEGLWKAVKSHEGDVLFLNRVILQLKQDSAMLEKALSEKDRIIEEILKIDENTYSAGWTLPYKYDSLNFDVFKGRTLIRMTNKDPLELYHVNTEITERLTQIDLTWGQEIVKNQLRVFVTSSYPGFTVSSMEGVMLDPNNNPYIKSLLKKKHWFQGFGVGPQVTTGYNLATGKYGFVVGVGITYNVYVF